MPLLSILIVNKKLLSLKITIKDLNLLLRNNMTYNIFIIFKIMFHSKKRDHRLINSSYLNRILNVGELSVY